MQRDLIGQTVLGYKVVSRIGSGAFGTVYKAVKNSALGEYTRALKHIAFPTAEQYASVLSTMGGDTGKADAYFFEALHDIALEVELLNALSESSSNHIVRYYESDLEVSGDPCSYDVFVLMEYATPLIEYMRSCENFTVRDVVSMGIEVLEGIEMCHDSGVIHRDIKEDNIFVSSTGKFKIGDFGVSKALKGSLRAETVKGTPNYLAPEVSHGKGGYAKSVDLYALGIVLYRLLNYGRNPFLPPFPEAYSAKDEDLAFDRRMSDEIPLPPALGDFAIGSVVVKAISGEALRYQSALSFAQALRMAFVATSDDNLGVDVRESRNGYVGGGTTRFVDGFDGVAGFDSVGVQGGGRARVDLSKPNRGSEENLENHVRSFRGTSQSFHKPGGL